MQLSEGDADLLHRRDPRQPPEFEEILGAEFKNVVKVALGDGQATVHVEFSERKHRVQEQFPFRRAVGEPDAKTRTRPVPTPLLRAVGRLDHIACVHPFL